MPRRDFIRDLQEASTPGRYPQLTNVKPGDDDGTISFTYVPEVASVRPVDVQLLVSDISCYPHDHDYFMYTTSDDVPQAVTAALEGVQGRLRGLSISDMLTEMTRVLEVAVSPEEKVNMSVSDHELDPCSESDIEMPDGLDFSDDEYGWSSHSPKLSADCPDVIGDGLENRDDSSERAARLAADLMEAKLAGFKVGYLGDKSNLIVSISCRIAKLGISDEAMQAWHVDRQQYLVLLIRYQSKYRTLEQIIDDDAFLGKSGVEMQADLCDSYKPTPQSALQAFSHHTKGFETSANVSSSKESTKARKMVRSFISKPLNSLLNERFVKILRYRHTLGFSWSGAELFFDDVQGKSIDYVDPSDSRYLVKEILGSSSTTLPGLITSDHLMEMNGANASFPLIGMQFVLRHFVRCTEFCLVCHCKTEAAFEALKPYVCSKSLCLYQYMALGFGPSLEWEILSQPYVVDLLVSFTYASAKQNRLIDFPTGLGFMVPPGKECTSEPISIRQGDTGQPVNNSQSPTVAVRKHHAKLDRSKMELLFPSDRSVRPVRNGDWIVITNHLFGPNHLHCRVHDVSLWPTVQLSSPVVRSVFSDHPSAAIQDSQPDVPSGYHEVTFVVYDECFDDITEPEKRSMIAMLLDTLPSVNEMKAFLLDTSYSSEPVLANWRERISKSALDVLRWIVASNRSCIIQDDPAPATAITVDPPSSHKEDRVFGMDGYMQFRFAQGAPDKEQRFVHSVTAATARLNLKYPTIFAWHGSPLSNWHGILREGLHFKDTLNGRAYGNGVYMSPHFTTSSSYACQRWYGGPGSTWPQSKLRISSAISLNEVVNSPSEFVSKSPHFVVAQLDWIQPRYLFVRCETLEDKAEPAVITAPSIYYAQDPNYTAMGPKGSAVVIPVTAVSQRRRHAMSVATTVNTNTSCGLNTSSPYHASQPPVTAAPSYTSVPAKRAYKLFGRGEKPSVEKKIGENKILDGPTANEQGSGTRPPRKQSRLQDSKIIPLADDEESDETDTEDLVILQCTESQGKRVVCDPPKPKDSGKPKTDFVQGTLSGLSLPLLAPPPYATPWATKALQRDLKTTLQIQDTHQPHELGWYIDPNLINTVYQWIVELHSFDPSLPLAGDLRMAGLNSVVLELRFSKDYPISPPFVRVIRPRFLNFLQGGGGHVTAGGALCMELLTNSGWSAVSSIESVLLQVRMAIASTDPKPARLEAGQKAGKIREYGVGEAVDAYLRACRVHGWQVPKDFELMTRAGWDLASS